MQASFAPGLVPVMALLLSGCTLALPSPWAGSDAPAGPAPAVPPSGTAGLAARACSDQAAVQGLEVLSVRGSRDVTGSGGLVIGQDVTLQVSRSGQSYDVRCSYTTDSGEARIMSL